jgi:mannose-6-phosphate isomerase-like protein (cupin superfamily)
MRTFSSDSARLIAGNGIQIGRWEQYGPPGAMPFGAMWCVVPPGGRSDPDVHPETELAVVLAGAGAVEASCGTVEVLPGTAVLLDPQERHVLHNRSADEPLVVLSVYWMGGVGDAA